MVSLDQSVFRHYTERFTGAVMPSPDRREEKQISSSVKTRFHRSSAACTVGSCAHLCLSPEPSGRASVRGHTAFMVAVQFVVVLLRLLRLPLLTQSASPQTLSPDNVSMQGHHTTRLIPETGPASSRYLQQMPPLKPAKPLPPLVKRLAAETAGTALIVGGGCGAVVP